MSRLGFLRSSLGAIAFAVAVAVPIGAFVACGQTVLQPKEPQKCTLQIIDFTIVASNRINPTDSGEPRPVQLRIYQLATDVRLNNAKFYDVWKDEKTALKEDLIKTEELTIYPDSRTDIKFERDDKAMFVAAVALFRTPKGRSWYTVFELPPPPGKGECFAGCPSGDCGDGGAEAGASLAPHYNLWIDGSKIDEGSDHIEDYPAPGRHNGVKTPFSSPDDVPGKSEK
jgi:type VI secretion system protein VasD